MTEQERPRTEAGPVDVLRRAMLAEYPFTGRFQTAQLLDEALEAARTEGRQEAVREIRRRLEIYSDEARPAVSAFRSILDEVDRVAGRDASESPPRCTCQRQPPGLYPHKDFCPMFGDASESPPLTRDDLDALNRASMDRVAPPMLAGDASESGQSPEGVAPDSLPNPDFQRFVFPFDNKTEACRHCPTPEVHPRRIGGELTYERDASESGQSPEAES